MAGQMRVTPAVLRAAAPTFTDAGTAVAAALRALEGALPGSADMCGSDDAGQKFQAAYDPRVAQIKAALSAIATGLPTVGAGLVTTADNVEHADGSSVMTSSGG